MQRLCECCGTADISHRHWKARYCLACRNSGRVLLMGSRARNFVNALVKSGILPRATTCKCVDCGAPAECYEHRDYAKPAEVEPVCRSCNGKRGHAANRFAALPHAEAA